MDSIWKLFYPFTSVAEREVRPIGPDFFFQLHTRSLDRGCAQDVRLAQLGFQEFGY
jgi:hypothetical protein